MTDQESTPAVEPGTPPSEPASPPVDSQTSDGQDVDAIVKAVLSHPDFQKNTQSVKDKRIAEIQTVQGEQGGEIARLAQALGHTPEEVQKAQTQIAMEDMVQAYQSGTLPPPGQVTDQAPQGSGVDLSSARTSILEQTGLTESPTGFDDYLASLDWKDPITATLSASKWVGEQKDATKEPSAATTPPPSGNVPSTEMSGMSEDDLGEKLVELQRDPTKNARERKEIMDELRRRRG